MEIARSFSYKLNIGNYQSADFFCSAKKEVEEKDAEKESDALYTFCKAQVVKSLNAYKQELDGETNKRARKIAKKQEVKDDVEIDINGIPIP